MSDSQSGGDVEMTESRSKRLCTNKEGEMRLRHYSKEDSTVSSPLPDSPQISMHSLQQYFQQEQQQMTAESYDATMNTAFAVQSLSKEEARI